MHKEIRKESHLSTSLVILKPNVICCFYAGIIPKILLSIYIAWNDLDSNLQICSADKPLALVKLNISVCPMRGTEQIFRCTFSRGYMTFY
jgi:predicted RNA-binding Zn-ribbon protein involved in translation (DUF1610 family)